METVAAIVKRSLILVLALLLPAAAGAQGVQSNPEYMRIAKDDSGSPLSLQTPIISFTPANGEPRDLEVDLIGAIHIADASYYRALNERFRDYDAVLYELVAPEGALPVPDARPGNLVSGAQQGITKLLGLTFQLNEIDYTRPNFVHADLTPGELSQSMSDRGESVLGYFSKLFTASMRGEVLQDTAQNGGPGLLAILFSPDREHLMKVEFASEMLDIEGFNRVLEGDTGSSLISERNARAVEVLGERIRLGDRRIAIFYGVAHLPNMASRLESGFGLKRRGTSWVDAWDLRPAEADPAQAGPAQPDSAKLK